MKEKLNFTVEDVTVIKENPNSNFAVLSLDFFASGDNLNDSYVSEETLMRTAETIKNCPLVWKYDERLDDIYTHDKDEVPCGFVPESSEIKSKKLEDGRTMLSVVAYVWRRYTGELLNIFRRDKGKKPVSVEILLYESKIREDGKRELLDFIYEGITILGSFVTPAIPLANATVLSFSKLEEEYQKDFRSEFFSSKVDMEIPDSVKEICRNALEERVKKGGGGTSEQISFAKFIVSNDRITPERVFYLDEYFKNKNRIIEDPDKESKDYPFSFYLLGGEEAHKWSQALIKQMSEDRDNKILNQEVNKVITFPYKSISEVNPALKGIDPPITLGQANEISRQADSIGSDDKKKRMGNRHRKL